MSIVAIDSFDNYSIWTDKWSSGIPNLNVNPLFVRTGSQSLNPFAGAFQNLARINFANRTTMIMGCAAYVDVLGEQLFGFFNNVAGFFYLSLGVNTDGSINCFINNANFFTSAPNLFTALKYNYVEVKAQFVTGGPVEIRLNGVTIGTPAFPNLGGAPTGVDGFIFQGSATASVYIDDFYLLDDTPAPPAGNDDFLGAVRIYAEFPNANESPLQFTPLAGTNFSEVNQTPPPGDAAYVFDGTVGDVDQYRYPITGPVGSYLIKGIQHSLDCKLDAAGSHGICSQIGAQSGPTQAVTVTYHMAVTPWDNNPVTGLAWQPTDFAATFLGPKIVT